jgi:hypothetical protein
MVWARNLSFSRWSVVANRDYQSDHDPSSHSGSSVLAVRASGADEKSVRASILVLVPSPLGSWRVG